VLHSLGIDHSVLARHIAALAQESPYPEFRLQSILTLGNLNISDTTRFDTIKRLILSHLDDPLVRDATLSSLANREAEFLHRLWAELPDSLATDSGTAFLIESLSQAVGKSRNTRAIEMLLSLLDSPNPNGRQRALLAGLETHASAFYHSPVALSRKPLAANHHEVIQSYFSWPGHTPTYSSKADIRPLTPNEQSLFARGRQVYLTSCVACHGGDGRGMKLLAPPLAGSHWVVGNPERLARVLFHGLTGPITVSGKRYAAPDVQPIMPPLANLSNSDTASVLTYIRREWGNEAEPIESRTISQLRNQAQGRTVPWTEAELEPFSKAHSEKD
jgi:mono/diheme cytochrome c family protein